MSNPSDVRGTLEVLQTAEMNVLGLLPYSSNYVFLAELSRAGGKTLAVYKPQRGERPLWDFPSGTLAAREVSAFEVGRAAGWNIVPPTVLRADAPLGAGSLQLFVEHDPDRHYLTMAEERLDEFEVFALLDAVINNTDRKSGHILEDTSGALWGVDHGLSFNAAPKLRTVIWAFAGDPIDERLCRALRVLCGELSSGSGLGGLLERLLSEREAEATLRRAGTLLASGAFPCPESDHHLPWPLV